MPPRITRAHEVSAVEESLKGGSEKELLKMLEFDYFLAGTHVYRGVNEKQKSGRPEFFALDERQARQYAKPWLDVYVARKSCKLVRNDYPIDLDECCLTNAYILKELAERRGCKECEESIRTLMIDDNVTDAFKTDKEIILFICSLGLNGWARMGEYASAPEVAFCPGIAPIILKRVKRVNIETGEEVMMSADNLFTDDAPAAAAPTKPATAAKRSVKRRRSTTNRTSTRPKRRRSEVAVERKKAGTTVRRSRRNTSRRVGKKRASRSKSRGI